uniref:RRM domain-containing protein n=1 Tax=Schistosoma mansoni TaxID=6183 RepID=A0A5K4FBQ6_SCHMA
MVESIPGTSRSVHNAPKVPTSGYLIPRTKDCKKRACQSSGSVESTQSCWKSFYKAEVASSEVNKDYKQVNANPLTISTIEQNKETLLTEIRSRINEMNSRTLYLRKLPRNTSLSQLKALCRNSANSRLLNPSRHLKHGHCRVIFTNQKDALEAFNTRHGVVLHDTPINLNFDLRSRRSSLLVRVPNVSTFTDPKVLSNEKPKRKSRKSNSHLNQQRSVEIKSLAESPSDPVKNSNLKPNKSKKKKYKNESASSGSIQFSLATNYGHQVSKPVPKKRKLV